MSFQVKDLSVLAYANGFTLWHYTTSDAVAELDTVGYFNEAGDMMRAGDLVISNYLDGADKKVALLSIKTAGAWVAVDAWDAHPLISGNTD